MARRRHVRIPGIPYIDPDVEWVGTTTFRSFNAETMKDLKRTYVVQVDNKPAAVVMPYETYMALQKAALSGGDKDE